MADMVELGSRRVLRPGKLLWLRAVGWAVLLVILVGGSASLAAGLIYAVGAVASGTPIQQMDAVPGPVHLAAMAGMALVSVLAYAALVRFGEDRTPGELEARRAPVEVAAGLAIGGAMMAIAVVLMLAAGWATLEVTPVRTAWRAIALTIESGVVEEVIFRLIVLRLLWKAFGWQAALAISAFIFGAVHLMNPNASWFAALCIMVEAGVMLATFYILTGRIWVSIGVHAGWNFTQGWIFGAAVSGTDFFEGGPLDLIPAAGLPDYLSGGQFGPEASLAGLLVGSVVGALTLRLAWRRGRLQETA